LIKDIIEPKSAQFPMNELNDKCGGHSTGMSAELGPIAVGWGMTAR
jgi:hypothetical protein